MNVNRSWARAPPTARVDIINLISDGKKGPMSYRGY